MCVEVPREQISVMYDGQISQAPLKFFTNFLIQKNIMIRAIETTHLTKQPIIMHRSLYVTNKTKLIFDLFRFRLIWHTLSDKNSADIIAENLVWCRKFCPPKIYVRRKFCPPKMFLENIRKIVTYCKITF